MYLRNSAKACNHNAPAARARARATAFQQPAIDAAMTLMVDASGVTRSACKELH